MLALAAVFMALTVFTAVAHEKGSQLPAPPPVVQDQVNTTNFAGPQADSQARLSAVQGSGD